MQTDQTPANVAPDNIIPDDIQKRPKKPQQTTPASVLPDACSAFKEAEARAVCRKCDALVSKALKMKCRPDGAIGCQEGENNCLSGYGVYSYKSGSCYEGEFMGEKRQGTGTLRAAWTAIFTPANGKTVRYMDKVIINGQLGKAQIATRGNSVTTNSTAGSSFGPIEAYQRDLIVRYNSNCL